MPPRRSSLLVLIAIGWVAPGCSRDEPDAAIVGEAPAAVAPIETTDDPRLGPLLDAAESWRKSGGPTRAVVDQVVLVEDVPGFLDALATWDARSYFPILIDDPRWTIPFIRAFRPAQIVRWPSTPRRYGEGPVDEWGAAGQAVARAWRGDAAESEGLPPSGMRPRGLGPTPPGLVLSHYGSPSLAGAAALAAGRFQPLVRVGKVVAEDRQAEPLEFGSTLTERQALAFARRVEARVASVTRSYRGLGDEVDFLTLAGDWPYRYNVAQKEGLARGERAVDDLIGRDMDPRRAEEQGTWGRWAFTGRLLGDAPTSVYRAMSALFLQPESALLWNTYGGGLPWSDYDVSGAAAILGLIRPGAVEARAGSSADLAAWHESARAPWGRDLLLMNSSGSPDRFSIAGGSGVVGDVPLWGSSAVAMIHSFSAADPTNPDTIAGRFLDRGAFIYYGSMNEPYLIAFRTPYIASQLMVAGLPLSAALRQEPGEALGLPWRLVYLGDPLYRVDPETARSRPPRTPPDPPPPGASTLAASPGPGTLDPARMLDWCYESSLLAAATFGVAATPAVLRALEGVDRGGLDAGRRAKLDALLIDRSLAAGDVDGLLDRLLRVAPDDRSPVVWRAIETAAFDRLDAAIGDGRFDDALNLWAGFASGPWGLETDLPGELTGRLADSLPPERIPDFRRRLVEVRDGLDPTKIPVERGRMLEEASRKVDKDRAR